MPVVSSFSIYCLKSVILKFISFPTESRVTKSYIFSYYLPYIPCLLYPYCFFSPEFLAIVAVYVFPSLCQRYKALWEAYKSWWFCWRWESYIRTGTLRGPLNFCPASGNMRTAADRDISHINTQTHRCQ